MDAESTLMPAARAWARNLATEHGGSPDDHAIYVWVNAPAIGNMSAARSAFILNFVSNLLSDHPMNAVAIIIHPNRAGGHEGRQVFFLRPCCFGNQWLCLFWKVSSVHPVFLSAQLSAPRFPGRALQKRRKMTMTMSLTIRPRSRKVRMILKIQTTSPTGQNGRMLRTWWEKPGLIWRSLTKYHQPFISLLENRNRKHCWWLLSAELQLLGIVSSPSIILGATSGWENAIWRSSLWHLSLILPWTQNMFECNMLFNRLAQHISLDFRSSFLKL